MLFRLREVTGRNRNASTDPLWFATGSVAAQRRPWTVLMWEDEVLLGAVLLREQLTFGFATGYLYASDAAADDFIVCHAGGEADVLRSCIDALIDRFPTAVVLLATRADYSHLPWNHCAGAAKSSVRYRLELKASWDETLKQFGVRSRRNLRYYPRRLMSEGAVFQADLSEQDVRSAALELRTKADFSTTLLHLGETFAAHSRTPGNFAAGLRKADGQWLSLLLGWREHGSTYVFFQMNDITQPQSSISTTIRSLFVQDEFVRGASQILFVSSSSSLMESGCLEDEQFILLLARRTPRKWIIRQIADRTLPPEHRLRKVLSQALPLPSASRP